MSVAIDVPSVYLDNAATTPVDPRVAQAMIRHLDCCAGFGNPSSHSHAYGWRAQEAVEEGRRQVAALIGCGPEEILWTSGATESNNLALKGAALANQARGRHLVSTSIEHKSVLDSCRWLETQGFEVTYLRPRADGLIDPETLAAGLRDDTVLCSVMQVNNEIGVIQNLAALAAVVHSRGALFHVDAAQGVGKVEIDTEAMHLDLVSLSAHKVYGPKGAGALYVRRRPRVRLEPQMHGGGQERGMRSGTLATHQIVGMGAAFYIAGQEMAAEGVRLRGLRDLLWAGLREIEGLRLNGHAEHRVPGNLNVSVEGVDGRALQASLRGLAVSSGSACASSTLEPSYVLRAIGVDDGLAQASIRFSIGRFNSEDDIHQAVTIVRNAVSRLRSRGAAGSVSSRHTPY
jgi:cysteine desulfurase